MATIDESDEDFFPEDWIGEDDSCTPKRRLKTCVENWPDCYTGGYNPSCCRFPKSCSADVYSEEHITDADLESEPIVFDDDEYSDDQLIRAKWTIDDSETLAQAADKARKFANWLQSLHDEGYILRGRIYNDNGWYYKPSEEDQ